MTLKYKQAVLIQNLVDRNSEPVGQPSAASLTAATESLIGKKARITFNNTVITVDSGAGQGDLELVTMPDRNLFVMGISMRLTLTKGNTVDGIVAATPLTAQLGTTLGDDDLLPGQQDSTVATTIVYDRHSNALTGGLGGGDPYPRRFDPQAEIHLAIVTDGSPTVNDTVTVNGTIDIFYFDISKPGL